MLCGGFTVLPVPGPVSGRGAGLVGVRLVVPGAVGVARPLPVPGPFGPAAPAPVFGAAGDPVTTPGATTTPGTPACDGWIGGTGSVAGTVDVPEPGLVCNLTDSSVVPAASGGGPAGCTGPGAVDSPSAGPTIPGWLGGREHAARLPSTTTSAVRSCVRVIRRQPCDRRAVGLRSFRVRPGTRADPLDPSRTSRSLARLRAVSPAA